jgi:hypothetical protein
VAGLRRELRDIVFEDFHKALLDLGYRELYFHDFPTVHELRGEWRRGQYHAMVESRGRKLVLHLHWDMPSEVGHVAIGSGRALEKEFRDIIRMYKDVRSTRRRI